MQDNIEILLGPYYVYKFNHRQKIMCKHKQKFQREYVLKKLRPSYPSAEK